MDEQHQQELDRVKALMARDGFTVVTTGPSHRVDVPYAYTAGRKSVDRPEIVVTGLPAREAEELLRALIVRDSAFPLQPDDVFDLDGRRVKIVEANPAALSYAILGNGTFISAVQALIANERGEFPDTLRGRTSTQPVLTPIPGDAWDPYDETDPLPASAIPSIRSDTGLEVHVEYPDLGADYTEHLRARPVQPGVVELTEHAFFMPLAPGDVVEVDGAGRITGVVEMPPLHTYTVTFYLPADVPAFMSPTRDHRAVRAVQQQLWEWSKVASVTQETGFSAAVSSPDLDVLGQHVLPNHLIKYVDLLRTPTLVFDFQYATQHPAVDANRNGPWA